MGSDEEFNKTIKKIVDIRELLLLPSLQFLHDIFETDARCPHTDEEVE